MTRLWIRITICYLILHAGKSFSPENAGYFLLPTAYSNTFKTTLSMKGNSMSPDPKGAV